MNRPLNCSRCQQPLPTDPLSAMQLTACPSCRRPLQLAVFPALLQPDVSSAPAEAAIVEGDAVCFYHATRRAQIPCDACGRFLCSLCDLALEGKHLCPACMEAGSKSNTLETLERSRIRHDRIVWYLLLVPLLLCLFLVPVTAPVAIIWAFVKRNAKPSRVDNTQRRLLAGMVFGFLELAAATATIIYLAATGHFD